MTGQTTLTFGSPSGGGIIADGVATDGDNGSTDIVGKTIDIYAINPATGHQLTSGGALEYVDHVTSGFDGYASSVTWQADNDAGGFGLAIKSRDGSNFKLTSLQLADWGGTSGSFTAEAFEGGGSKGIQTFTLNGTEYDSYFTLTLNTLFGNVDEVRIYKSGGGNSWLSINNVTIADAVPPAPSAPTAPDLASGSDSGSSSTDDNTNDNTPTFSGSGAEAGATVRLYANGTEVGSATADASGNWTVTSSVRPDGNYTFTARVENAGGLGPASAGLSVTIDTAAPMLDANGAGGGTSNSKTYIEDSGGSRITTSDATLTDLGTITGLTMALAATPNGTSESIAYNAVLNGGVSLASLGLTGSYDPATHTYTVSGTASAAVYQGVMRAMVYTNTSHSPVTGGRTVTISATDSQGNVGQATANLSVQAVNDAPTATNLTSSAGFTEDQSAIVALDDIFVTDVDGSDVITATLTLSDPAAGSLTVGTFGSATSTYDAGTGVWTVVGSVADVNAALASVGFTPAANWDKPLTIATLIRDASNTGPAPGLITLDPTPVNDAPTVSVHDGMTFNEDGMIALTNIVINDVDGDSTPITLSLSVGSGMLSATPGAGVTVTGMGSSLTLSGTLSDIKAFIAAGMVSLSMPANSSGSIALTANVSDGSLSGQDSTTVIVRPIADAPTVTDGVGPEGGRTVTGLVITPSSVDGSEVTHFLISDIKGGILYRADGITRVFTGTFITLAQGAAGLKFSHTGDTNSTTGLPFSFKVQASVGTDLSTLSPATTANVTITEVNDAPLLTNDVLPSVQEDSGVTIIQFADLLANDIGGPYEEGQTLTITGVSNPVGGTVEIVDGHIEFTPGPNYNGTASFQYTVRDNGTTNGVADPKTSTGTVSFTVAPAADAPQVTDATTLEDQQSSSGLVISRSQFDGMEVQYLKITGITGGTLYLNDGVTPVTEGSFITIAQGEQGLKFTPSLNFHGTAGFDVQASLDAAGTGLSEKARTTVTVTSVNDAPTAQDGNLAVSEMESYAFKASDFGFADANDAGAANSLAAIWIDELPSGGTLAFDGAWLMVVPMRIGVADIGRLTYLPEAAPSSGSFKFRVEDDGGTANGGQNTSVQKTMQMNVLHANDAPVVTAPATLTAQEDTSVVLTGISFSDPDAGPGSVTVTLNAESGTLFGTSGGGVTVTGHGTGTLTLIGTISSINAFIGANGVSFQGAPNASGQVKIGVEINDGGNSGAGGALTDTAEITVDVASVNDAPVLSDQNLSFTVTEDAGAPVGAVGMTVADLLSGHSDADAGPGRGVAIVGADSANGTWWYSTDDGASWQVLSGVSASVGRLIGEVGGRVYFQPNAGYAGTVTAGLTLRAWDMTAGTSGGTADVTMTGGTTAFSAASDTVSVSITPLNDAPVLTVPASVGAHEDTLVSLTGISVSDADAGSGPVTVTLTAASGLLSGTTAGAVTVSGSGTGSVSLTGTVADINAFIASSGLGFQAPANAHGSIKVQVSVNDLGNTGTGGALTDEAEFDVVVAPVNDAPTSADRTVTLLEDGFHTFVAADFAFADATDASGANELASVIIDGLPDRGTLTLDGVAVVPGQEIGIADIVGGKLVFTPVANENGAGSQYSGFTFRVKDDGGTANGGGDTSAQYRMRIDVTPANDAAVIGGDITGSVTEDGVTSASGILTVTDIDPGEAAFLSMGDVRGTYGTFSFDHLTGAWTYVLDNDSTAVQSLREGEVRHDTFNVKAADGTERTVTVAVAGTKDADVIDGMDVDRKVVDNGDGTASQVVTIPVVTAGRKETDGSVSYADIPLVTVGGRNVLAVQLGIGIGLTATGSVAPKAAGSSLADLIREINANTTAGSADQASLTSGGSAFLASLPTDRPIVVQSIVATQSGPTSGVPLVICGSKDADAPATALVIDARNLSAGTVIEIQDIAFATVIGNVRVTGGSGSQVVYGDAASQHMVLGADDDTIHGGGGDDYVGSLGGNDRLYGDAGNDTLSGGIGNDTLDGGTGHDVMYGGDGNDVFRVDSRDDRVVEYKGQGIDSVHSSVSYELHGTHVENLVLTGSAAHGYGNSLANRMYASEKGSLLYGWGGNDSLYGSESRDRLYGSSGKDKLYGNGGNDHLNGGSGNDRLDGGAGRDYLTGGSGNDVLKGGDGNDTISAGSGNDVIYGGLGDDLLIDSSGRDTFVFDTKLGKGNVDTIRHFNPGPDTIRLDDAIFTKAGPKGWLKADAFHIGAKAADAEDRIVYDAKKGALYYDKDGAGGAAQVQFAKVDKHLHITSYDFYIA